MVEVHELQSAQKLVIDNNMYYISALPSARL